LSARWCPVSAKARAYLRKHKIHFREYDIEHQARGRGLYAYLGTRAVPVILVGRQYMYGFYAADLARMLRHRRGR
jgi:glutaredoxin